MTICALNSEAIDVNLNTYYFDNSWSVSGIIAHHDTCNPGIIYVADIPIQIGKTYTIHYTVTAYTSGSVHPLIGGINGTSVTSSGSKTAVIIATSGTALGFYSNGNLSIRLDAVVEMQSGNGITIAYNEKKKGFSSFYSYIPESMVSVLSNFMSFKDGKLYLHNADGVGYNKFYGGDLVPSEIVAIVNPSPEVVKTFLGIYLDSSSEWELKTTDYGVGILTSNNQESNIIKQDYRIEDLGGGVFITKKEGVFYADFYRDVNSPGGLNEGDVLNGNWMRIKLTNDEDNFVSLWSVFINTIV